MVAIIDYGIGNIGSIYNMLKKIGENNIVRAANPEELYHADKIILPGVGAYDMAVTLLKEKGFWNIVLEMAIMKKKPLLGICLGMQLLGMSSEEGNEKGLELIPFSCKRFCPEDTALKVPHMGWDYVSVKKETCPLTEGVSGNLRFYFVHSYYAVCDNNENILMTCRYGKEFAAAVHKNNIYGMQFHPEKSHRFGMELLSNFVKRC